MSKPPPPFELDVRPLLATNRPPLPAILAAVSNLEEGQSLRLTAPFEPAPLRDLLAKRGFSYKSSEPEPGVWIVEFAPQEPT